MDVRVQLGECNTPLMYLAYTNDEVMSMENLKEVLALALHIQLAEIEEPHFAHFTNPVQSAEKIVNFLCKHDGNLNS